MSQYPDHYFVPLTKQNRPGCDYDESRPMVIFAEDFNLPHAEIVAIQHILGLNPEGTFSSVVDRLDDFDDQLSNIPLKASKAEASAGTDYSKFLTALSVAELYKLPEGVMYNGKIVPSVSSNNLTVAIKGKDGNDPSSTNPVYVVINGTLRTITSALSVTKNAGTNWFNAGSAELATKEIDYFVYLGYNVTDGVVIGFSRIPSSCSYDGFSSTSTNEKYCAISTINNASSTDFYNVIGRFSAVLSAGAGYTWSVPTYTAKNLIQRPIFETRWLDFTPQYSSYGSMTYTSISTPFAKYKFKGDEFWLNHKCDGTTGGTASFAIPFTLPFSRPSTAVWEFLGAADIANGSVGSDGRLLFNNNSQVQVCYCIYNTSNFSLGATHGGCSKCFFVY